MTKFLLLIALCSVGAGSVFAAEPAKPKAPAPSAPGLSVNRGLDDLFPDEICARGKGVEVRRSQLADAFLAHRANLAARGQILPEEQRQFIESKILDRLIVVQLLTAMAGEADRTNAQVTMEKILNQYKASSGSEETFQRQLKAMGLTVDQLRATLLERAICDEVLDRELKAKQIVTDEQARKYYEANPAQFEQPEMVRVTHILISTRDGAGNDLPEPERKAKRELGEKVLKRARAGENFGKLVSEFSDDPNSKSKGGEYTFPRGTMVAEFESAAFALGKDQISDLVITKFGFHIIKKLERIPAGKVELAKVQEKVKETLMNEEVQKQLPEYLDKLKKGANVEILDPNLKLTGSGGLSETMPPKSGRVPPKSGPGTAKK